MDAESLRVEVKHYSLFFESECGMRFTDYLVNVLVDSLFDVDITAFYFIYMVLYVGECPALLHDFVLLPPVIDASRGTLLDDQLYWK